MIQFTLTQPDYNFPYILAYSIWCEAHEVVEYYKDRLACILYTGLTC